MAGCLGDGTDDEGTEGDNGEEEEGFAERLAASDPWRDIQHDAANSGHADVSGPTTDVDARWTLREHEPDAGYNVATPAVVDGTVYAAEGAIDENENGFIVFYALEGDTGNVIWERTIEGTNSIDSITVVDGRVVSVVGSQLLVLDADSGTELLRAERDLADGITVDGTVAYAVKTTYADPPTLHAIDLETGTVEWRYQLDEEILWPNKPAVVDGTVYQGTGKLTALSGADGTELWSVDVDGGATAAPTVVDDTVYVPSGDGAVIAFDRSDGSHRWTGAIDSNATGSGVVDEMVSSVAVADGSVFATTSWTLTVLDDESGEKRWSTETVGNDPPVVADDIVYVSGINELVAYDGDDGDQLLSYETDASRGRGVGPAVLDGVVLYPSDGLYALTER